MKLLDRGLEWCHRKISPNLRVWPAGQPLLRWNSQRKFTVSHSLEHVLALGATGSGKTSAAIKSLSLGMLHAGYGVLFLTAKADDAESYFELAKRAGRENSVVRFGPGHRLGCNLLEYELGGKGIFNEQIMNVPGIFSDVGRIKAANKDGGEGDKQFWVDAAEMMMRYSVNVVVLATGKVELNKVVQVALSAPKTANEAADSDWRGHAACYEMLTLAEQRHGQSDMVEMARQYFLQKWPNYAPESRGSAQFTCDVITDLCQGQPLRRLFFSKTDFTPDILTEGAVLIVDAPALKQGIQGKVINGMMRLAVERMVQKRADTLKRPVAIIWDEFQTSITEADSEFAAVARSPRCALVMATQNVNAVQKKMGRDGARALYGNCRTKLFFANDDPDTNQFMADVAGKWEQERETQTKAKQGELSTSTHTEDDFVVPPREALTLESGGEEFGGRVSGILVHGGRKLKNEQPWMKVAFKQNSPLWHWWNPMKVFGGYAGAIGRRHPAPDFRWLR